MRHFNISEEVGIGLVLAWENTQAAANGDEPRRINELNNVFYWWKKGYYEYDQRSGY